jgi:NAD(P)-dependent dehydrogenase (short-subunit alcohol dehydrogenase family)
MSAIPPSPSRPVAVVTGGRRGIGAAIAKYLATNGFDIAITDLSDEGADAATDAIVKAGGRALFVKSDLAEVADHARVVQAVADWGGAITCLVNNAGMPAPSRGDLLDMSTAAFDRVLDVNLRGTFFTQTVSADMPRSLHPRARSLPCRRSAPNWRRSSGEYRVEGGWRW